MKRRAKENQPQRRSVKSATFDIKVLDPKRLELQKLIKERKRITRKIRNLPTLQQRLAIENPSLSIKQLLERLQKRKSATDKAIAKHDGFLKRRNETRQLTNGNHASVIKERAQMSIEEILARQNVIVAAGWQDIFQQSTCSRTNGRATPYLTRTGNTVPDLNSINHNSSAGYLVDQQSYLMSELDYLISAWLNDDASIWRDDNPDSVMWYDNVCLYLPTVECDSTIVASLSIRFSGEIYSEADDHNEIRQYVYVAYSDEYGNLPPYVSFGQKYELNNLDLSGEIGLPSGNHFDSEWVTATMSFNVKSGAMPKVAVANCTQLDAQDGTLKIIGAWRVTDLAYSITPL